MRRGGYFPLTLSKLTEHPKNKIKRAKNSHYKKVIFENLEFYAKNCLAYIYFIWKDVIYFGPTVQCTVHSPGDTI